MHLMIFLVILSVFSSRAQSEPVFEKAHFNTKLDVQAYKEEFAADVLECSNLCEDQADCQSLNYIITTQICQFLNHSDKYKGNKLVGLTGVIYMKNTLHRCFTEKPYACQHGECFGMPDNQFRCICDPGYYKSKCEYNINECLSYPCQNSGLCFDRINGYICECTSQFMGVICEVPCNLPLGMENGNIKENQLTGYRGHHGHRYNARLNNAGYWAGVDQASFIQINFHEVTRISKFATQGAPSANEWVTEFELFYWSSGGWTKYSYQGLYVYFPGNTDRNTIVTNILQAAVELTLLRIEPRYCHNYCSMRFELYGCVP